jgi:hypothetical protein
MSPYSGVASSPSSSELFDTPKSLVQSREISGVVKVDKLSSSTFSLGGRSSSAASPIPAPSPASKTIRIITKKSGDRKEGEEKRGESLEGNYMKKEEEAHQNLEKKKRDREFAFEIEEDVKRPRLDLGTETVDSSTGLLTVSELLPSSSSSQSLLVVSPTSELPHADDIPGPHSVNGLPLLSEELQPPSFTSQSPVPVAIPATQASVTFHSPLDYSRSSAVVSNPSPAEQASVADSSPASFVDTSPFDSSSSTNKRKLNIKFVLKKDHLQKEESKEPSVELPVGQISEVTIISDSDKKKLKFKIPKKK